MGWGRAYFAAQAALALAWWVSVFTIPPIRRATLGELDPVFVAVLDARFGEPFRAYRRAVRCWLPRLRPVPAGVAAPALTPGRPS